MHQMRSRLLKVVVAVVDILLLNFANTVSFWLRFHAWPPSYNWMAYERLLPWESLSLLVVFYFYGLYNYANKTSNEMKSAIVTAVIINGFLTLALTYLLMNIGFPRSVFLIAIVLQIPLFGIWHLAHRSYVLRSAPRVPVLVIGPDTEWPELTVRAGQFLPRISVRYATPEQLQDATLWGDVRAIVLGHVDKSVRERCFVTAMARNIPCLWPPDTYDVLISGAQLTSLGDAPMFSLPTLRVRHGSAVFKRAADIVVAAIGLVVGLPIFALLSLAIVLDSGRPVFFRQERVTAGGRTFGMLKFRTMIPEAETATGPVLSPPDDPRVTRVGRFLRVTHLDELPQLWNILIGDMSLVGPRPERPVFVDHFRRQIPHYDLRHLTTPGLTGLAQVAGSYSSSPEDKATYDVHYAKTWSWIRDFSILIQTILQWRRR